MNEIEEINKRICEFCNQSKKKSCSA